MKTLIYFFAFVMLLFAGCVKDEIFNDVQDTSGLKKAKVPVPMKGEMCMISNDDRLDVHFGSPTGPVLENVDLSRTAFLNGHMTHTGNLNEQSFMTGREGAYIDAAAYSQGKIIIVAIYDAMVVAANHDYYNVISYITIDVTDPANRIITGTVTTDGGTGKFENASGEAILNGVLPCWTVEGMMEFN